MIEFDTMEHYGPDSLTRRASNIFQGAVHTTFYIIVAILFLR